MRRNILGASNTLLMNGQMKIEIRIKIIEGCCNGLSIARQCAKPPGPKLKNGVSGVGRPPKWAKAPRVKL
jgi:hypothetical protein